MSYFRIKSSNFAHSPKVYLRAGARFSIWLDSGKLLRRLTLDHAVKQSYVHYEDGRVAFGGEEYQAILTIRNSKIRITIEA